MAQKFLHLNRLSIIFENSSSFLISNSRKIAVLHVVYDKFGANYFFGKHKICKKKFMTSSNFCISRKTICYKVLANDSVAKTFV